MKKIFLFAAAAALLTACSSEELSTAEIAQQKAGDAPVAFSIYTPRNTTRAGMPLELTTKVVGNSTTDGFGVFAYYSNGDTYANANTYPNFMYNQQVKGDGQVGDPADDRSLWTQPTTWSYEPVKYWPNEFGSAATSDDIDRVSFFAYAPWTQVDPSTGTPIGAAEDEKNIIGMTRHNQTGDPIIKYVVDTDPKTSVDLLWGVAGKDYTTKWGTTELAKVLVGNPFIDLVKPTNPAPTTYTEGAYNTADEKVSFNLRHALAKLNVQIDYVEDAQTPGPGLDNLEKSNETKIYIREIKIGGFSMKGALNLNNKDAVFYTSNGTNANTAQPVPNWKTIDGLNTLVYEPVVFKDGRRDGKEGTTDGIDDGESFLGLNPSLVQSAPYTPNLASYPTEITSLTTGVTKTAVNLFANWSKADNKYVQNNDVEAPIFVIPNDKPIDIEIVYDVETVNPKVTGFLSDGIIPGVSTENKISKKSFEIFNTGEVPVHMQAGEFYVIKIHVGMLSIKVDAEVEDWIPNTQTGTAELPKNQN